MNDTVSGGNHHKSDDAQSSAPVDIPAEILDLGELADTAAANFAAAEAVYDDISAEYDEIANRLTLAYEGKEAAERADRDAHRAWVDALKRHGYVRTADGLKPRDPQ